MMVEAFGDGGLVGRDEGFAQHRLSLLLNPREGGAQEAGYCLGRNS